MLRRRARVSLEVATICLVMPSICCRCTSPSVPDSNGSVVSSSATKPGGSSLDKDKYCDEMEERLRTIDSRLAARAFPSPSTAAQSHYQQETSRRVDDTRA